MRLGLKIDLDNNGDPQSYADENFEILDALSSFTNVASGLCPASGGGTTNFMRADGTWAAPSGSGGIGTYPAALAYSSTQNVATGTNTTASYNTVSFDNSSNYNNSTYRFTAQVNGVYLVRADMTVSSTAGNNYQISIYKNGSSYKGVNYNLGASNSVLPMQISELMKLNATDYVEVSIFQDSGSTKTFTLKSFSVNQVSS